MGLLRGVCRRGPFRCSVCRKLAKIGQEPLPGLLPGGFGGGRRACEHYAKQSGSEAGRTTHRATHRLPSRCRCGAKAATTGRQAVGSPLASAGGAVTKPRHHHASNKGARQRAISKQPATATTRRSAPTATRSILTACAADSPSLGWIRCATTIIRCADNGGPCMRGRGPLESWINVRDSPRCFARRSALPRSSQSLSCRAIRRVANWPVDCPGRCLRLEPDRAGRKRRPIGRFAQRHNPRPLRPGVSSRGGMARRVDRRCAQRPCRGALPGRRRYSALALCLGLVVRGGRERQAAPPRWLVCAVTSHRSWRTCAARGTIWRPGRAERTLWFPRFRYRNVCGRD